MKHFKSLIYVIVFSLGLAVTQAQTTVIKKTYPRKGTVVTTIHRPNVVVHKKTNYYFSDGVWYTARGKQYVVTNAPIGIKVRRLPRTRAIIKRNGVKYYKYRGVWYTKTGRYYTVVNV